MGTGVKRLQVTVPSLVFAFLWSLRIFGGSHWWGLTVDSVFYATTAEQTAKGDWPSAIGAIWMPLTAWVSAPLVYIGVAPTTAILIINLVVCLGLLNRFHRFLSLRFNSSTAIAVTLLFAVDPMFVQQASAIGSDALFLALSCTLLLRTLENARPGPVEAVTLALCLLCRIPGLGVAAFLTIRWGIDCMRGRLAITRYALILSPIVLVTVLLSSYFRARIGVFAPSASFALNHFFLHLEWLNRDPNGWCRLFDGLHTVLGDLNQLRSRLPEIPVLSSNEIWDFRIISAKLYAVAWIRILPIPLVIGTAWGVWKSKRLNIFPWMVGWCLSLTLGMVFTTYVPRYFLPVLPACLIWLAHGLGALQSLPWRRFAFAVCFLASLGTTLSQLAWGEIFSRNRHDSAGHSIFLEYGSGHRIATERNLVSAVQSRSVWFYLPCESASAVENYLHQQSIEFVIVSTQKSDKLVGDLVQRGTLTPLFEQGSDAAFRVLRRPQSPSLKPEQTHSIQSR